MGSLTASAAEAFRKASYLDLQGEDHVLRIRSADIVSIIKTSRSPNWTGSPPSDHEGESRVYQILWVHTTGSASGDEQFELRHVHIRFRPSDPTMKTWLEIYQGPSDPRHLHITPFEGLRRIHVIISTLSGRHQAENFFDDAVEPALEMYGFHEGVDVDEDSREGSAETANEAAGDVNEESSSPSDEVEIDDAQFYEVHYPDSANYILNFARKILLPYAKNGVEQTVLLLSGDGGISDLVNVIQNGAAKLQDRDNFKKPTIGLIPMGTGNALANSTGINSDATRGLRHFLRGSPQPLPVFRADFSRGSEFIENVTETDGSIKTLAVPLLAKSEGSSLHGAVVCSWGLHASLVADSDTAEYRKYGPKRFRMAAQELSYPPDGSAPHVYKGRVTMLGDGLENTKPGRLIPYEHIYVMATMVSDLQEGVKISPQSKPLDGIMRLIHLGPLPSDRVLELMGKAGKHGNYIKEEEVNYGTIGGLRIDFHEEDGRWRRVCVDGRIIRVPKGGWVEVKTCKESFLNLVVMPQHRPALDSQMNAMTLH